MDIEEIEIWKNKLLDLSKRNPLISYKDTKKSTITILGDVISISTNLLNGKKMRVEDTDLYDDIDEFNSKYRNSSKNLLLYNPNDKTYSILNYLKRKNKEVTEEKGINVLYLALGLAKYKENNDQFDAPILLLPIAITQNSKNDPFYIEALDDEFIINPTFNHYCIENYKKEIPPILDSDLLSYFLRIEEFFDNKLKCILTGKIGIFSFQKISMYNDLLNNEEKIINNINIQRLINKETPKQEYDLNNITLHNVVDADFSQQEAIKYAKAGYSFVLQGPPGTGKSQTITNIIAEFLYEGKKVLFVSEKLAALNVVYNNLAKAELSDYCLLLHSDKTNKKEFIDELYRVLNIPYMDLTVDAIDTIEKLAEAEKRLDEYCLDLHNVTKIDKSLYEIIDELSKLRDIDDIEFVIKDLDKYDSAYYKKVKSIISSIEGYTSILGDDYREYPYYGFIIHNMSYELQIKLKDLFNNIDYLFDNLVKNIKCVNTFKELEDFIIYLEILDRYKITQGFLSKEALSMANLEAKELNTILEEYKKIYEELSMVFDDDVFFIEANRLYNDLLNNHSSIFKRLGGSYKIKINELRSLLINPNEKIKYKKALYYLKKIDKFTKLKNKFDSLTTLKNMNLSIPIDLNTNYKMIIEDFDILINMYKKFSDYKIGMCDYRVILDIYEALKEELGILDYYLDKKVFDFENGSIVKYFNKFRGMKNHLGEINSWINFNKELENLYDVNLLAMLEGILGKYSLKMFTKLFDKTFLTQILYLNLNETSLNQLTRVSHDHLLDIFTKNDLLSFEVSKAQIKDRSQKRIPKIDLMMNNNNESVIVHEHNKSRRHKSIYNLMHEISDTILNIKPVFLMSPLSVSTYLDPNKVKFDCVIFDEASQVYPCDAIGAIYRSNQVIIVGDSKQMPPTSFFDTIDDLENDDNEISDYESILDLCQTRLPSIRLNWHYRSRVEELIAFSNKFYYDGRLVSFPSTYPNQRYFGIDFIYVSNGRYEQKTQTNLEEAKKIVDLIYDHAKNHSNRSLGVVAFNKKQQALIYQILNERRNSEPIYEDFFNENKKDSFFVKNLETVQGDERDTIIISVCYGFDKEGVFNQRFGPLGILGGERRLNVLVSRAKINMVVVSSIRGSDINIARCKNDGPKHLAFYLDFAENKGLSSFIKGRNASYLSNEIKEFIIENGYNVELMIGFSTQQIEIAVYDSNNNPICAIETDGFNYISGKNVRDRDRLRQQVLENMGWRYYRIWSFDWLSNKEIEKNKLLEFIKNENQEIQTKTPKEDNNTFLVESDNIIFDEYIEHSFDGIDFNNFDKMVGYIIELEAPVSYESLLKRSLHIFSRDRISSFVKSQFNNLLISYEPNDDLFYYTNISYDYALRIPKEGKRDIMDISLVELSNGLYTIIEHFKVGNKEEIFMYLAKKLGYRTINDEIKERLEKALLLISNYYVIKDNIIYDNENKKEIISRS